MNNPAVRCQPQYLAPGEIHLWCCQTTSHIPNTLQSNYLSLLSHQEVAKIQRYRFTKDQYQCLMSRALIRHACTSYLGKPPQQWQFYTETKGKPYLKPDQNDQNKPLQFNLSHTQGYILLAICQTHEIGCDIEYIKRSSDTLSIADRYFSAAELDELRALPAALQKQHFFDYWTLKESYIKASGVGLSIPLDAFSFAIDRSTQSIINSNIQLNFHKGLNDTSQNWKSFLFNLNNHIRGAVSINAPQAARRQFNLRFFNCLPFQSLNEFRLDTQAVITD